MARAQGPGPRAAEKAKVEAVALLEVALQEALEVVALLEMALLEAPEKPEAAPGRPPAALGGGAFGKYLSQQRRHCTIMLVPGSSVRAPSDCSDRRESRMSR